MNRVSLCLQPNNIIILLFLSGVKAPKAILLALRTEGLVEPMVRQVRNYLQRYKTTKLGPSAMNLAEFIAWCQQRSTPSPSDLDEPFVINYGSDVNEDGMASIKCFMSTPRLLELATQSSILHTDATYKLNWDRLPTIIVGTTDQDRHFHPFGVGLSSGETANDFAFMFRAMVDGVQRVFGVNYQPGTLVADAADAITNGFRDVFGNGFKRVTCWAHMVRAVDKQLKRIANVEFRERILADIHVLQLCQSELIFDAATRLFIGKWSSTRDPEVLSFLRYFQGEWIAAHKNWFEGFAAKTPSTNNALESVNRRIKADFTFRNRLPLARFLHLIENNLLRTWSRERNPVPVNCKKFALSLSKSTALWTDGYQWSANHKQLLSRSYLGGYRDFFIPSGDAVAISPALVNTYRVALATLN